MTITISQYGVNGYIDDNIPVTYTLSESVQTFDLPSLWLKTNSSYLRPNAKCELYGLETDYGAGTGGRWAYTTYGPQGTWLKATWDLDFTVTASQAFNANNSEDKVVSYHIYMSPFSSFTATDADGSYSIHSTSRILLRTLNVELDAPPTFNASPIGGDSGGNYYVGTVVSTDISNLSAKYGGYITSVALTIGDQSTSRTDNGTLLIRLNSTGTFVPKVTVTDSRGQTTTQTLPSITVTNKPPSFKTTQLSLNTDSAYVGLTTATATISELTAYSGSSISSVVLRIGNQTDSRTTDGALSITLDTVGTFTPTITATDTNGKTTTITLNSITVTNKPPSFNSSQVAFYEYTTPVNTAYSTLTKARVTISNLTAYNSATITSVVLKVGTQTSTARTTNGDLELTLNTSGVFTPKVVATDSNNSTTTITLNNITVNAYNKPTVTIHSLERYSNSTNKPDNEGTVAVITASFTYTNGAGTLVAPTVKVDGTLKSCTWYTTRASDGTISNQISSWSNINTGTKVYGRVTGTYDYSLSYSVSVTPTDTHTSGAEGSAVLIPAFYTIDVQHGGKEIAFGAPANDDLTLHPNGLFKCDMDAWFNGNVHMSGGGGGTDNYESLVNKPQIEGVTLIGNKTFEQLNLLNLTNTEIESLLT